MQHEKFINDCKTFIKQFDKFKPAEGDGLQQSFAVLIEQYKASLTRLENSKDKLIEACSIGEINAKKREREKKYPREINNHHALISSIIGGGVLLTIAGLISTSLGSTNMEIWPTYLPWMSAGIGAGFGAAAGVPIYIANRRHFDRNTVRNKNPHNLIKKLKLNREQLILAKLERKEQALAQLAVQVHTNMDKFLSGDYSLKEKQMVTKTVKRAKFKNGVKISDEVKKDIEVEQFKKEYESLPWNIKRKLHESITEYNKDYNNLVSIGKDLDASFAEIVKHINNNKDMEQTENKKVATPDYTIDKDGSIVLGRGSFKDITDKPVATQQEPKARRRPIIQAKPENRLPPANGGRK